MAKDVELFRAAMAGVKPLEAPKPAKKPVIPRPKAEGPLESTERPVAVLGAAPAGGKPTAQQTFDRDIDRALAKGKRRVDAKLDLHGMTLASA